MQKFTKHEIGKICLFLTIVVLSASGITMGLSAINAILIKRLGVKYLPYTYILISSINTCGTFLFLMYAGRIKRTTLFMILAALSGIILLVARPIISSDFSGPPGFTWNLSIFFILIYFAQGFPISSLSVQIIIMMNEMFRPNQGRRLFPIFTLVSILGGVLGGIYIHILVPLIGVVNLFVVWGCLQFAMIPLTWLLERYYGQEMREKPLEEHRSVEKIGGFEPLKEVYQYTRRSPISLVLFASCLLFCLVSYTQNFQYNQAMNLTFHTEDALSKFTGTYTIFWSVTALFLQFFVSRRLMLQTGIFRGLLLLPLTTLVGFIVMLVHFGFWEAVGLRYSFNVMIALIYFSAFQLAFNVIPSNIRGRVLGVCNGIVNSIGTIFAGLMLILFQETIPTTSRWQYIFPSVVGIACCLIWFFLLWRGRRVYTQSLLNNLFSQGHKRTIETLELMEEKREPVINKALTNLLLSQDEQKVNAEVKMKVMEVISKLGDAGSLRALSLYLNDDDPQLRLSAILAISDFNKLHDLPFAFLYINEEMKRLFLQDHSGVVRQAAGKFILKFHPRNDLAHFVDDLFQHPDRNIRLMTIQTIGELNIPLIDILVVGKLEDEDPGVRSEALYFLWQYPNYKNLATSILRGMLEVDKVDVKKEEIKYGLIVLIRLGSPPEYLKEVESFLSSSDHLTRSLACIFCLSIYQEGSEEWQRIQNILLETLADSHFDGDNRKKFVSLIPNFQDKVIDSILDGLQMLPPEKHAIASQGFESFAQQMYEKILNQA